MAHRQDNGAPRPNRTNATVERLVAGEPVTPEAADELLRLLQDHGYPLAQACGMVTNLTIVSHIVHRDGTKGVGA
jgi:hypothetical protein